MKGSILKMNVVIDYKDNYAALPITIGDFIEISNQRNYIREFSMDSNGKAMITVDNVMYSLGTFNIKRLGTFGLTLKEIKQQLDFIISVKYLARLHVSTYGDANAIIRRSADAEFKEVFGDKSKVEVLVYYGEYFKD